MKPVSDRPSDRLFPSRHLVIAALGIVYGDIGTSPLYTLRETFGPHNGLVPQEASVLGVLSLVFWALLIVVTLKYVILILRADNRGEGGVLALGSLLSQALPSHGKWKNAALMLAVGGLALFYGDALITPAISVLSAVEGLKVATPVFEPYVVPIALGILVGLFLIQARGTHKVGGLFGPVMSLWFVTLATLGLIQIVHEPTVLRAMNPYYALVLIVTEPTKVFLALGSIVLAVTGAEALYADMGHFGRSPIRHAWFGIVLPALVLNYFGQGALLLNNPDAADHLFFMMAPDWALYPLIVLATLATIIASQAVISGVFSMTRQAVLLGLLPRMAIRHTSASEIGQVYIPRLNWILMVGVILLVVGFASSSRLAAAYGIAVTGTVAVDAVLALFVAIHLWQWKPVAAIAVFASLLLVDLAFLGANVLKIPQGGWFPLMVAGGVFSLIVIWRKGRRVLLQRYEKDAVPFSRFIAQSDSISVRVEGTAVFMTTDPNIVPRSLVHNLRHNKVLHTRVILMRVLIEDVPWVPESRRIDVTPLGKNFYTVVARYGFMDQPDVPRALAQCRHHGLDIVPAEVSYFLNRETILSTPKPDMGPIEAPVFIALSASAMDATNFFRIPPEQVLALGAQIEV